MKMKLRLTIIIVLALSLSAILENPAPVCAVAIVWILILAIRDSAYDHHRASYRDRYITDSIDPDRRLTNLYGELIHTDSDIDSHERARKAKDLEDWNTENHTQPPAVG
jgi:hypothetical protein